MARNYLSGLLMMHVNGRTDWYLVSGLIRRTTDIPLFFVNSRMKYFWVALILSPWVLLNSSDGAAVTNFYHSFTNKKFGGDSTCVTATDVSSSSGVEGDKRKKNLSFGWGGVCRKLKEEHFLVFHAFSLNSP